MRYGLPSTRNSCASITVVPIIVRTETRNGIHTRSAVDRRQPDFDVLVLGHELGRRPVGAVAGDRHVAGGADGDRPVVALRLGAALADIGEVDVEAGVAVEDRDLAVAGLGRRHRRPRPAPEPPPRRPGRRRSARRAARAAPGRASRRTAGRCRRPVTALAASAMRIVRVIWSNWRRSWRRSPATRGPRRSRRCPVEAPRALARQPREPGELGVGVESRSSTATGWRRDWRADRQADQRDAVGGVQHVGVGRPRRGRAPPPRHGEAQRELPVDRGVIRRHSSSSANCAAWMPRI